MGEYFNRRLVEAVAPIIVSSERLYQDKFDESFCRRSLLGYFSKFWFPKELTDPSAQRGLIRFKGCFGYHNGLSTGVDVQSFVRGFLHRCRRPRLFY